MTKQEPMSIVTDKYLTCFHNILDQMVQQMNGAKLTNSISCNYIVQMIPHHKAAIEMSCNILQYTTLIPLQEIALSIIKEQTKSIETMEAIRSRCQMFRNQQQKIELFLCHCRQITQTMFEDMRNACSTNDINADFIREMIPHHRGAIQMSRNALQFPVCQELKPVIQSILVSQQNGIREMECLLKTIENCHRPC